MVLFSGKASSNIKTAEDQGFVWNDEDHRWLGPEHAAANYKVIYYNWMLLERAGVVFLPLEPYRYGTKIVDEYSYPRGTYWSVTPYQWKDSYGNPIDGYAYGVLLKHNELVPTSYTYGSIGANVRLVKDVE